MSCRGCWSLQHQRWGENVARSPATIEELISVVIWRCGPKNQSRSKSTAIIYPTNTKLMSFSPTINSESERTSKMRILIFWEMIFVQRGTWPGPPRYGTVHTHTAHSTKHTHTHTHHTQTIFNILKKNLTHSQFPSTLTRFPPHLSQVRWMSLVDWRWQSWWEKHLK